MIGWFVALFFVVERFGALSIGWFRGWPILILPLQKFGYVVNLGQQIRFSLMPTCWDLSKSQVRFVVLHFTELGGDHLDRLVKFVASNNDMDALKQDEEIADDAFWKDMHEVDCQGKELWLFFACNRCIYIYTNILSYCYTISLFYMVHSFLFWTLKVFTSTRKKDTYLTSGSPCFGEPTNLPPQKVLLGSLRLLKDTSRSAFFLNCTTLFSGGLQRQALRQTLRKLRFLNQVLGIWAI